LTSGDASPDTTIQFAGQAVTAGTTATDFTLADGEGRRVSLKAPRGGIVLLTFLYTQCRDVCPLVAQNLNTVLRRLGPRSREVRVLAVSVDPVHDTRVQVRRFTRRLRLRPEFSYLIGTERELQPVWQAYNVLAFRRNEGVVDHSAPILLIDRAGRPRVVYGSDAPAGAILGDVRRVLD
jgi:protein SCO1/2